MGSNDLPIFPGEIGADELDQIDFDRSSPLDALPPEAHYRRGYRDGFIEAVNALQDLPAGISSEQLLHIMFNHWQSALFDWQRRGETGRYEQPPAVEIAGDVRRRQFKEAQRRLIIEECGFRCSYCFRESRSYLIGPGGKAWHIDHRQPLARGGTNDHDNLVLACSRCNTRKHTSRW